MSVISALRRGRRKLEDQEFKARLSYIAEFKAMLDYMRPISTQNNVFSLR